MPAITEKRRDIDRTQQYGGGFESEPLLCFSAHQSDSIPRDCRGLSGVLSAKRTGVSGIEPHFSGSGHSRDGHLENGNPGRGGGRRGRGPGGSNLTFLGRVIAEMAT